VSDGWTAAIAIAGVVGTLSAAFGVPMLTDHLQRKRDRQVAFRLVGGELAQIATALGGMLEQGRWPYASSVTEYFLPRRAWEAYQPTVALELKHTRDWETVALIYLWMLPVASLARENPGTPIDEGTKQRMIDIAPEAFRMARFLGYSKEMLGGADESPVIGGGATGGANAP